WAWEFGDGSTSDVQNPVYTYVTSGLYAVTLTVVSSDSLESSATVTKRDFINIREIPDPPTPDFGYSPRLALAEEQVDFAASGSTITSEPIEDYLWDFGDESPMRKGRTTSHRYADPGRYSVTLTVITESTRVSDPPGVSVTHTVAVDRAPVSEFDISRRDGDGFIPASQGYTYVDTFAFNTTEQPEDARPIRRYTWDFGDEMSSELAVPTHEYEAEGRYRIKLTVAFRHSASRSTDSDLEVSSTKSLQVKPSIYDYVNTDDSCYYHSEPVEQPVMFGDVQVATAYLVHNLTSQCWNPDDAVVDLTRKWTHPVTIIVPENKICDTAMLFIDGGSRTSTAQVVDEMWQIAVLTGTTVVHLKNVPSQPIVFKDEVVSAGEQDNNSGQVFPLRVRTEDAIIAYSYDKYMDTYDSTGGHPDYSW
ncbi:MAG: PKD domain-containing protein, partial [Candidatus Hydrogenedentes bacterium]|nr:PKD domain-containing protein [Candidatus Hydrogenedentota bacterium]